MKTLELSKLVNIHIIYYKYILGMDYNIHSINSSHLIYYINLKKCIFNDYE